VCDASGPGSNPGRGTLKLDKGYHLFESVKCLATSKQWITVVEDCGFKLLLGLAAVTPTLTLAFILILVFTTLPKP